MADIYLYAADATDFTTLGLCGALTPTRCTFEEVANGLSEIEMEHPIDPEGRHRLLVPERILRAAVPVRTTPEIDNGEYVLQVELWTVKTTASKAQRYVYSKREGGKKKKLLKGGTAVTVVRRPADSARYKIKTGRVSGWMDANALEQSTDELVPGNLLPDTAAGIEQAAPAWACRDQLFRIYDVERSDGGITCRARHISYDLLYNLARFETDTEISLQDALDGVLDSCAQAHEFTAYTDYAGTHTGAHYVDVDPITALLDPDTGLCEAWGAQLVRDDYELFLLSEAGLDRGVRIEYAKNLLGVRAETDYSDVATRILPVGETKSGKPLYLSDEASEQYIDSPRASQYAVQRVYRLECEDCKVSDEVSVALARSRMREQAEKLLEDGCDLPTVNVEVDFINLGDTLEYAQYRALESVFLFDSVSVYHPILGIDVKTQVTRIEWDCLAQRMERVELGDLADLTSSVAGWQIAGGISGDRILAGSLGSAQLGDDIINARHVQAESISAEAIQAGSVTADKVAAGFLYAQELVAQVASIVQANIDRANIGSVEIDYADIVNLKNVFANIADAQIGSADIDYAQIKTADVRNLITYDAVGEKYYIADLAVSEANIVSLTAGEINLTDNQGNIVKLVLDADTGEISTQRVQFDAQKIILANSITANELNVDEIFANAALIGRITSAHIAAGAITVNHLSSDVGAALDISSNAAIRARVTRDELEAAVADATGSRRLELWYTGAGGFLGSAEDESVITAHVYQGEEEITDTLAAALFVWSRDSTQAARAIAAAQEGATEQSIAAAVAQAQADDAQWAQDHAGLTSIQMGASDVMYHSIIACEIAGAQALYAIEITDGALYGAAQTEADGLYIDANGVLRANASGYALDEYGDLSVETALGDATLRAQLTMTDESASPFRTKTEAQLLVLEDAIESKVTMEQVSDATADIREAVESITPGYIVQTVRQSNEYLGDLGAKASASSVTALEQTASSLGARVTSIEDNGVDKVTVSAAMKFDLTGLRITQSGTLNYLLANTSTLGFFNANDRMLIGLNSGGEVVCTALRDPTVDANMSWRLTNTDINGELDSVLNPIYTARGYYLGAYYDDVEIGHIGVKVKDPAIYGPIGPMLGSERIFVIEGQGVYLGLTQRTLANGSDGPVMLCGCHLWPKDESTVYLGASSMRWAGVFLKSSPNVSSDARLKQDVVDMDGDLIDHLRPRSFRMKADPQKQRFGFIAQEVQDALRGMGIDDAALVDDENPDSMGMCYEQIIAPLVAKVQAQQRQINDLENRLKRLEGMLNG